MRRGNNSDQLKPSAISTTQYTMRTSHIHQNCFCRVQPKIWKRKHSSVVTKIFTCKRFVCNWLLFLKHTSDKKEKYGFEFAKDIIWWNWCQWQKRSSPLTLGSDVRYFRDFRHHWAEAKDALQLSSKWNCGSFKEGAYLFIYESKEDFSYNMSISDQQDNVFSGSYNFVDMPDIFGTFNIVTFLYLLLKCPNVLSC